MRSSAIVREALVEMKHNGQKFNKEYSRSTSSLPLYSQSTRKRSESSIKSERGGSKSQSSYLCVYPTNGWTYPSALIRRVFQLNHETLPFASYRQVSPPPYTANGAMIESLSSRSFWRARRCLQSPIEAIVAFIHFYAAYSGRSPLATVQQGGRVGAK